MSNHFSTYRVQPNGNECNGQIKDISGLNSLTRARIKCLTGEVATVSTIVPKVAFTQFCFNAHAVARTVVQ